MNRHPIFIAGAHKSGTSLIRNLLDSHTQLYSIPFETHYFQNIKYWVDNEYRKQTPVPLNNDQIIDQFIKWIDHSNKSEDYFSDSVTANMFDMDLFKSAIQSCDSNDTDSERMDKYFSAIYYSLNKHQLSDDIRIVEKSVENAEFAVDLYHYFPKAKFIHIVRNPYSNFVSLRKYKSIATGYPIIRRMIRTLYNNNYFLYHNKRRIPDYYILKYEELLTNPRESMIQLSQYLEIPFEETLLQPTTRGSQWAGNSTTGAKFDGIDSSTIESWKKEITPMEIKYINKMFQHVISMYNYPTIKCNQSGFWLPNKGEDFKRYFANRLYYYFL